MATGMMLCDDPLFASDSLFCGGMSLDLEDLFSDDLMGALLGTAEPPHGATELLVAPPAAPAPAPSPAQQPSSSGSGSGTAAALPLARSPSPSRSTTSGQSQQQQGSLQLPRLRSAGPPTRGSRKTSPASTVAPLAAATTTSVAAPAPVIPAFAKAQELAALLGSAMSDDEGEDSDASNDTDEGAVQQGGKGKSQAGSKRKAPEIDWRSITDPAERRRQRRLAKNRMTAARSRERKKVQWADMEAKLAGLDNDNKRLRAMLQQLAAENSTLRGMLEGQGGLASRSASASASAAPASARLSGHSNSTEPAALVFIAILLLLCCALPGDRAMLLGSAAPMLLLAAVLAPSSTTGPAGRPTNGPSQRPSLASALLRLLLSVKLLLARSAAKLRASVHRMLFKRHYHVGRVTLRKSAAWASLRVPAAWPSSAAAAAAASSSAAGLASFAPSEKGSAACTIVGLPPLSLSSKPKAADQQVPQVKVQMVKALSAAPVEPLMAVPSLGDEVLSSFMQEPFDMPMFDAGAFLVSGLLN